MQIDVGFLIVFNLLRVCILMTKNDLLFIILLIMMSQGCKRSKWQIDVLIDFNWLIDFN